MDGINWTNKAKPLGNTGTAKSCCYGNEIFMIGGINGGSGFNIAYSTDNAYNWIVITLVGSTLHVSNVSFSNGYFWIAINTSPYMYYTSDLVNFLVPNGAMVGFSYQPSSNVASKILAR